MGVRFRAQRQFDCAADAFRKALALRPDSAKLSYQLGDNLYSAGKTDEAIQALQQSIHLDPKALTPHLTLATALDRVHRNFDAEIEWREVLVLDPHSRIALDALTRDLLEDKDFNSVISLLHPSDRSAALTPERSLDLALAYSQIGLFDDAATVLRDELRTAPSSVPLIKALAGVLVMQARKQEAVDVLESAIKQHPREMSLRLLYLHLLVLNDEPEKARPVAQQLLKEIPTNWEVLYLNGLLEQRSGDYAVARDHLQRAATLNPDDIEVRQSLGSVLAELKDEQGARDQLEKAISLGSQDPETRFKLATVLRSLGETQKAQEQLALYQQEKQQKSNLTQAAAKAALADQKVASGDFQQAIELYRAALDAAPREAPVAYKLAMTFDKVRDLVNERAALEQAIQIDSNMAEAYNQLGYLDSRAGDSSGAEAHFQQAVHASPRFTKAWINLGATLFLENKSSAAKEAAEHALQLDPGNVQALRLSEALSK